MNYEAVYRTAPATPGLLNKFQPSRILSSLSKTLLQKHPAVKYVSEFKDKFIAWPSSVAPRPAGRPGGRPGSGRSRRRGRWQRCFTPRRFKGILNSGGDCKLNSNHRTLGSTVVMGLELQER